MPPSPDAERGPNGPSSHSNSYQKDPRQRITSEDNSPGSRIAEIPAIHRWRDNGELIADVAKLHLRRNALTLDATYGRGVWWRCWRPDRLVTYGPEVDFRALPDDDATYDLVAFDPPYKLNGTPTLGDFDYRYGVHMPANWQQRIDVILDGVVECARVLRPRGTLLVKVQDQVARNFMRWQTYEVYRTATDAGLWLVDEFTLIGHERPQPKGRPQRHARGRGSTLMVFRKAVTP
jgi:hypothetical protein